MSNRTVSVRLQAEIGSYVTGMARAATATKSLGDSAAVSTKKAKAGFDLAGKGALLLGGAVAGALVGIVTKSTQFETAMSAAGAATRATGSDLLALREAAIQAGADTQYSATEAAQAITEMGKAGVSTADILGGGLNGALALAAAGQLDVAEAAGIASVAMTQFKLSGDQLPHVADLLAAGAGKAMGSVEDLGMALNQAGLVASATGVSIEETTGTLAAFASAGLIGSDAGTSFRSMLQHLQNPSKESAEAMANLGIAMYDANGAFVGIESLAGQLHDKLGPLSQATRDQALAQIFGSDAVRAANVLYEQGAEGIAEWTRKVNDAGYAQEQAAALTDNLAGDIERLGGAFDTFLISAGEGSQSALRELVQGLTGIVDVAGDVLDFWSSLPGPVQVAVAGFLAWAVAGGKVLGVLSGLRDKLKAFREESALQSALQQMQSRSLSDTERALGGLGDTADHAGGKFSKARSAIGNFARAIGPELGAALAAAVITDLVGSITTMANAGDAAATEVKDLNESLSGIDSNTARIEATANAIEDLRGKLADANDAASVDGGDITSALGNPLVLADVTAGYKDAAASADVYKQAIADLEEKQAVTADTAERIGNVMGISADAVLDLADKYGVDLSTGLSTAYPALLLAGGAIDGVSSSAEGATLSGDVLTTQLQGIADSASAASTQIDLFKTSLDVLTGADITLAQAQAAVYAVMQEATTAITEQGGATLNAAGALNLQTENGRAALGVITDYTAKANEQIGVLVQQGGTFAEVSQKDAELRAGFLQTLATMGITGAAADRLADQYYGIPTERRTQIEADTNDAELGIQDVQNALSGLPLFHNITVTTTYVTRGVAPALNGPAVYDYNAAGGIINAFAGGGFQPMSGGIAKVVPPGTKRIIGDNLTSDEAYIPINGSVRSRAVFEATASRMGYQVSREFSGRGLSGTQVTVAAPDMDGMQLTGTVRLDPASGLMEFVDTRITSSHERVNRALAARGVR
jgi:TP901 family phage tail tape measure protein